MNDNLTRMNPLYGVYSDFEKLLSTIIIKYNYLAEETETFESKRNADSYLACRDKLDTYFTYRDYTVEEFLAVGIYDATLISRYSIGDGYLEVPNQYREPLLLNRRNSILKGYSDGNDYYRTLNGQPPINTSREYYHYLPDGFAKRFSIDKSIPIHKIQDYYNSLEDKKGDYLISNIEGLGYIKELQDAFPNEEYLKYLGSKRIDISIARKSKNFQILYIDQNVVSNSLFDVFISIYDQCRDYFVSTIFVREYRNIFPYYDRLIALCIMVMTIQNVINKQFPLGINREFYNSYTIQMLYTAYGVPYNMNIDSYTQKRIIQSLNLLIQRKSTDKVIYDIAAILGYTNLDVYKYYLTKNRKFDIYGVPIIKYKQEFNNDTGEYETIPDYEAMYDLYFQKVEISNNDIGKAFGNETQIEYYENVTNEDPFWWKDTDLYEQVWKTEYNFVESKYLSLGISYKMTEIMYENILLLKLLISEKDALASIKFTLPKISPDLEITLFDAVILLFCLTSRKHNLRGEIISIPSQVLSVLDYLKDVDGSDEYLVDSFGFDINLLQASNIEGQEMINTLKKLLEEEDIQESSNTVDRFMGYIKNLYINPETSNEEKVTIINDMYNNIKGLSNFLQYMMSKTDNKETYEKLKEFYNAVFYAKEVKNIFTINNGEETERTAKNYFEFLYYHNPKLYSSIFVANYEEQYSKYCEDNHINTDVFSLEEYEEKVKEGSIDFSYASLNTLSRDIIVTDDLIYYYVDHVVFRMESYIKNLKFIYMINDTATPIENLLLKLIKFFKSFTVDLLGLDCIYITDLKAENIMRYFDKVVRIKKDLQMNEHMKFSYMDSASFISEFNEKDDLILYDKEIHYKTLDLTENKDSTFFTDKIVKSYYTD